ncbi:MAG: hypothetical protein WCQ76_02495 [Fusobacterium sp.]
MKKLLELGFKKIGKWSLVDNELSFEIDSLAKNTNIVVSFVQDESVKYISLAEDSLENFLIKLSSDGDDSKYFSKIVSSLKEELKENNIEIYAMKNKKFFGFMNKFSKEDINKMIHDFSPLWNQENIKDRVKNMLKKDRSAVKKSEKEKIKNEIKNPGSTKNKPKKEHPSYIFVLTKSYYERGFFNIKTSYSHLVSNDKVPISIVLGPKKTIVGRISRTANATKIARVIGNKPLRLWFEKNSGINKELRITFINKKKIKIEALD